MELISPLKLYLSCEDIPAADEYSGNNYFAVVYLKNEQTNEFNEVGRTETIENQTSPVFSNSVVVEYEFEKVQEIRIEIYNQMDQEDAPLEDQTFIGSVETKMSKFMGRAGNTRTYEIRGRNNALNGTLNIRGIEIGNNLDILHFQLRLGKIKYKQGEFFYEIYQLQTIDQAYVKVFTSERVEKVKSNATFKFEVVPAQKLCNADESTPIKFVFYVWRDDGRHAYIGEHETSVKEFVNLKKFEIANLKGTKPKKSGVVSVLVVELKKRYSFLEYISSGCEISLFIGIDFTKSNKPRDDKDSLHFIRTVDLSQAEHFNQYQLAIWSVGRVLEAYDTDKQIPVYGFGGMLEGETRPNHDFPLTFDADNDEVNGIEGVMDIYEKALNVVKLSGPTFFAPILRNVFRRARDIDQRGQMEYYVMLILTDGQIDDMNETVKTIVDNAHLPVSIIIAGVGDADFENMAELDGDNVRLHYMTAEGKKEAVRDIVQFVPMNEFAGKGYAALAEKTLEEIPEQVTSYYTLKGVAPSAGRAENMQALLAKLPVNQHVQIGNKVHRDGGVTALTKAAIGQGHLETQLYAKEAQRNRQQSTAANDSFRAFSRQTNNSSNFKSGKWFKKPGN